MNPPLLKHTLTTIAFALSTGALLIGCNDSKSPEATSSAPAQADTPTAQSTPDIYEDILGKLVAIPIAGDRSTSLRIHHQQIANFRNEVGVVNVNSKGIAGMPAMTMPYPVADGVSIEGLAVGDKIRFSFRVNWGGTGGPAWEVTKIEKIDPGTEIDYTNKIEEVASDPIDTTINQTDDHAGQDNENKGP